MKRACSQMKTTFARHEAVCGRVLGLLQLLSNKTRFRIVCLLLRGEFSVSEIVEVVSEGQFSNVSQQLKVLTLAGIIERRRLKRQILYTLKDERVRDLIQFLQQQFLDGGTNRDTAGCSTTSLASPALAL